MSYGDPLTLDPALLARLAVRGPENHAACLEVIRAADDDLQDVGLPSYSELLNELAAVSEALAAVNAMKAQYSAVGPRRVCMERGKSVALLLSSI